MSLSRKIVAEVVELAETHAPPLAVTAEEGPHKLVVAVGRAGPVGFESDGLEFFTLDRTDWSIEALRAWGDRLAARLTYLMEPLVVLEVDAAGGEVELRSEAPTPRAGHRDYYEIQLRRKGVLRLDRVRVDDATRRRRPVSFQMTNEVLERLADDLVACAG
jgi:hypothetical protein